MKLSVIVPVYNAGRYLHRCIDSILSQNFEDFELLLINDGSTDDSGIICDEYAKKDSRVKVVHKHNEGQGKARNDGIKLAQGKYLLMPDSDDYLLPGMFETMVGYAEKYNAECVCAGYDRLLSDGSVVPMNEFSGTEVYNTRQDIKDNLLYRLIGTEYKDISPLVFSVWTKLYLKDVIVRNNIVFEDVKNIFSEDLHFNYNYLCHITTAVGIPDRFYVYCENPASTSNSYDNRKFAAARNLYTSMCSFPYIKDDIGYKRMMAANVMGLFSVHIKLLIAINKRAAIKDLDAIVNDSTVHEMASLCQFSKIKFPLNLFCFLIRHRLKYTLYLLISLFLKLKK